MSGKIGRPRVRPCGTEAAYRWHLRHGEPACPACLAAVAAAEAARRAAGRRGN